MATIPSLDWSKQRKGPHNPDEKDQLWGCVRCSPTDPPPGTVYLSNGDTVCANHLPTAPLNISIPRKPAEPITTGTLIESPYYP